MANDIGRRQFIAILGGSAAWPVRAAAQQPAMPVIALIGTDAERVRLMAALRRGLRKWASLRAGMQQLNTIV
jgi:hypothetical protein